MVKKILDLDTKDIFYYIFSSYFLFGMRVSVEPVGGYGLYLPFNIIGWMFISLLIGLGLYQISKSGKLFYSNLYIHCMMGSALLLIPFFYSNNIHAHLEVMRLFGLGGGLLGIGTAVVLGSPKMKAETVGALPAGMLAWVGSGIRDPGSPQFLGEVGMGYALGGGRLIPKATVNPERKVLSLFFLIVSKISNQRSLLNII